MATDSMKMEEEVKINLGTLVEKPGICQLCNEEVDLNFLAFHWTDFCSYFQDKIKVTMETTYE